MMRGNRGYIRGGRGASSYRGQSTSTYRGNSSGGHSAYNNNSYVNRDHSASGGSGAGIGGRYSGGGGMMNEHRGRGGFDHSFNSNSSSRYAPPVSSNPRYLGNNPLPDGGYNKRPYPSSHSSRDRSPDRKRNRPETSRRNDDYGQNNSSYNSGGSGAGGGGNTYNNRYDGNNSGGGFQPTRRYETNSRGGGGGSSSQPPNNHRSTAYRPSNIDDHVSRPVRNHDRYGANEPLQHHHHHNNNNTNNSHHSSSGQYSPPVRRPYVGRGGPSNRIISTYRGRGNTYGRGTSIRRPYGTTLHARSSIGGYGAPPSSGAGHSSYVRRTTTAADAIRRKMLMPKLSTATDMARKLKIAKLRSTIRKNNEKKGVTATDGDSDTETPSKGATNMDLDEDEELECDPDDDGMEQDVDDAAADTSVDCAEKKVVASKKLLTSIKVEARSAKVKRAAANDEEVDEDELQLDNDVDDDIDNEDGDNNDDDDQPEYAVQKRTQKRTYIKLDCAHCRRSYFTIKSYNFHLYGSQHKNALFQTAQRQKAQVARIRVLQRRAQRELEDAQADVDDEDDDEGAGPLLGEPQFCMLCRLNYRSDVTEHQQSKEHRQIKRILKPSCRTCQVGFTCPMDYEMHRASLDHLKMEAEAEEMQDSVDVNWGEFQTVDSIGDVDDAELLLKNADDEAAAAAAADAHDEDEDSAAAAAERRKRNGKTATTVAVDVRSPVKEPVNIGVEMIREIQVMYCDVCRTTLTHRTDPEVTLRNHCRWRTHIKLYNQHMEAEARRDARKRKQQQLEKAAAEKRKKIDTANGGGGGNAKSSAGDEKSTAAVVASGGDAAAEVTNAAHDAPTSGYSAAADDSVNVSANSADAAGDLEEPAAVDDAAAGNKVDDDDDDDDEVVDDKMWADVDKDLGELLQAVNSENANDDEDEDSTANTERYDRFKNSEQDKPTDGSAGPSGSGQSKPTAVEAIKKTTSEIGVVTSSADKTNTGMHAPN